MLRVNGENIEVMPVPTPWGGGRFSYNGVPITGIVFDYYPGTNILAAEEEYRDGYQEGLQINYWSNGQKKSEWYSKNGDVYKYVKEWDEQGNLYYHVTYDDFGNKIRIIKHPNPDLEE